MSSPRHSATFEVSRDDVPGEAPQLRGGRSGSRRIALVVAGLVERYGLLILLIGLCVFFGVLKSGQFPQKANIANLLESQAISMVVALAFMVPLITDRFDLSIGTNLTLSSLITAKLMSEHHVPLAEAIAAALVVGLLIGVVNGTFVAYLGVNSFIVTLATSTALGGVITWYSGGNIIATGLSTKLTNLGFNNVGGLIPVLFIIAAVILLLGWYLLRRTPYGRHLTAIGANENAAVLVGLKVRRAIFVTFLLAGLLGAAAGVMHLAEQGSADPSFGGLEVMLPALAGVFLGSTVFRPGEYNVLGTVVGLFVVAVLVNGLALMGAATYAEPIVDGIAVLLAVTMSTYLGRRRAGET